MRLPAQCAAAPVPHPSRARDIRATPRGQQLEPARFPPLHTTPAGRLHIADMRG
jgi:hypothetical protein